METKPLSKGARVGLQLLFFFVCMPLGVWLSTPVHEAGHALGALMGGAKVVEVDFFDHVTTTHNSGLSLFLICAGAVVAIMVFFAFILEKTLDRDFGIVFVYVVVMYGIATLAPVNWHDFSGFGEYEGIVQALSGLAYIALALFYAYRRTKRRMEREEEESRKEARKRARAQARAEAARGKDGKPGRGMPLRPAGMPAARLAGMHPQPAGRPVAEAPFRGGRGSR